MTTCQFSNICLNIFWFLRLLFSILPKCICWFLSDKNDILPHSRVLACSFLLQQLPKDEKFSIFLGWTQTKDYHVHHQKFGWSSLHWAIYQNRTQLTGRSLILVNIEKLPSTWIFSWFSRFSMFPSDIWQKTHFPQTVWDFFVKLCKKTDDPILIKWWWDVDGNFVSCNKKIIKAFLCFSCRDVRVMGLPQWSSLCNDRSQCQFFSS